MWGWGLVTETQRSEASGAPLGAEEKKQKTRTLRKDDREKKKCVGGRRGEAGLVIKVLSDTARRQRLLGDPEHINHPSVCQPPSIIAASPALSSCWSSLHSCLFPSSLFLLAFLKVCAFSSYTAKKRNGAELCLRPAKSSACCFHQWQQRA